MQTMQQFLQGVNWDAAGVAALWAIFFTIWLAVSLSDKCVCGHKEWHHDLEDHTCYMMADDHHHMCGCKSFRKTAKR